MLDKKLSRRDMLKLMGLATAGAFVAACGPKAAEPGDDVVPDDAAPEAQAVKVIMMYNANELADDEVAQFNEKYAPITLERIDTDLVKLFSMLAAGQQVDSVRLYGTYMPAYVSKGVALDLTSYFKNSEYVPEEDLLDVNDLFLVEGKRYGMVKDWSPDYAIFANKSLWEEAGVDLPDPTEDVNYRQYREWSSKLTQKDGDRTTVMGTDFNPQQNVMMWLTTTFENPTHLFNSDFTKLQLLGNPETKEAAEFFIEWMLEGGLPSAINPFPSGSWTGVDWQQRMAATVQWGYWFSGMAETENVPGEDIYMMKAPTWGPTYSNPCASGCGIFATSQTKTPNETWKSVEWFMGEEPAEARASSGWGTPGLKRLLDMMPRELAWRKQCYDVVQYDIENSTLQRIEFSPYTTPDALMGAWSKYLGLVLNNEMDIETMLAEIEMEVNLSIEEGIAEAL